MQQQPQASSTAAIVAKRLLGVCVSALVFWLVVRRLDAGELSKVLSHTKPGWLLMAFGCFALATMFAALRWHAMLKSTGAVVHLGATFRFAFIGNFFNALLLGPAGGDVIKTGLYSRWFHQPLPHVVAASFVDRLLGVGGSVLLAIAGIVLALIADGGEQLHRFTMNWPAWPWVAMTVLILGLIAWWWRRRQRESFLGRTATSLEEAAVQWRKNPQALLRGVLFAFILQVCFCGVMACSLQAVASEPIPWLKLAWTFPAIGFAATMPVTVAGAGVREGAAMLLFGFYGVKEAEAIAASLLTLTVYVVWALGGGISFLLERRRMRLVANEAPPKSLSAIIPLTNERVLSAETLAALKSCPAITEIIMVADGSKSAPASEIAGVRVIRSEAVWGKQMQAGAEAANGDVLLFLHPDTQLDAKACEAILSCLHDPTVVGGGCWKRGGNSGSWRCWTRLQFRRVLGEQAIFVRRAAWRAVAGLPLKPNVGELELCRRLRRVGRIALAPTAIGNAAVR
ncbi:MAG TPA: lysylphosphatidylglycerol synthase domain-containing protein [Verrucomicrobiae bacterium]